MFAFLAEHRAELFPDADYAGLFAPPGRGRPSVPATQMAAVMTLQGSEEVRSSAHRQEGRGTVRSFVTRRNAPTKTMRDRSGR
jgi:hypothetical protein